MKILNIVKLSTLFFLNAPAFVCAEPSKPAENIKPVVEHQEKTGGCHFSPFDPRSC